MVKPVPDWRPQIAVGASDSVALLSRRCRHSIISLLGAYKVVPDRCNNDAEQNEYRVRLFATDSPETSDGGRNRRDASNLYSIPSDGGSDVRGVCA